MPFTFPHPLCCSQRQVCARGGVLSASQTGKLGPGRSTDLTCSLTTQKAKARPALLGSSASCLALPHSVREDTLCARSPEKTSPDGEGASEFGDQRAEQSTGNKKIKSKAKASLAMGYGGPGHQPGVRWLEVPPVFPRGPSKLPHQAPSAEINSNPSISQRRH